MPSFRSLVPLLFIYLFFPLFFPPPLLAQTVVINEFLPNPNPEWVEFYQASASADFLKSYWLDDDLDFANDEQTSPKKLLANLNTTNPNYPYFELNSFLNNDTDFVVLFDPLGHLVDQYQYHDSPTVSLGRSPDQNGPFTLLASTTKGAPNSQPQPTPTPTVSPTPQSSPSLTPTPTPPATPKPTATATPKPTLTSASVATASSEPTLNSTINLSPPSDFLPQASVLGVQSNNEKENSSEPNFFSRHRFPLLAIIAGALLLLISAFLFLKEKFPQFFRKRT